MFELPGEESDEAMQPRPVYVAAIDLSSYVSQKKYTTYTKRILVMGDDMVKVVAWYDNKWRYSQRVVDLAHLVASKWSGTPVQGSGDPLEDLCKDNPAEEECKVYEA